MSYTDVAPSPSAGLSLVVVACAALACLFTISAIALTVILVRRNRKSTS